MGELAGVTTIDGHSIGDGKIGPMTQRLSKLYARRTAEEGVQVVAPASSGWKVQNNKRCAEGPVFAGNGQRLFSLGDRSTPVQRPIGTAPGVGLEFRWDQRGVLNMPA